MATRAISIWKCEQCLYEWLPRSFKRPARCPNCRSTEWDEPLKLSKKDLSLIERAVSEPAFAAKALGEHAAGVRDFAARLLLDSLNDAERRQLERALTVTGLEPAHFTQRALKRVLKLSDADLLEFLGGRELRRAHETATQPKRVRKAG